MSNNPSLLLLQIFSQNPLTTLEVYCNASLETTVHSINQTLYKDYATEPFDTLAVDLFHNLTSVVDHSVKKIEPNTALLSFILMIGTYAIAHFLKVFRNGKYLGRTVSMDHKELFLVQSVTISSSRSAAPWETLACPSPSCSWSAWTSSSAIPTPRS
jgi:hypothetical protein